MHVGDAYLGDGAVEHAAERARTDPDQLADVERPGQQPAMPANRLAMGCCAAMPMRMPVIAPPSTSWPIGILSSRRVKTRVARMPIRRSE